MNAKTICLTLVFMLSAIVGSVSAAEVIPKAPDRYFNDYAGVISKPVAKALNLKLEQFERDTSNQFVVMIYPKMQSDSDPADYTFRVKETWHVGQKLKDNGAVLFVFVQDHKVFIQVNYGLEGVLTDAKCKDIIDLKMEPYLLTDNYDDAVSAAVSSMIVATWNENQGNGHTAHDALADTVRAGLPVIGICVGAFFLLGLVLLLIHAFGGTFYGQHAVSLGFIENVYLFFFNVLLNVVFSGSSSSSSGSGGFSGGGGRGGGGGAGGSW